MGNFGHVCPWPWQFGLGGDEWSDIGAVRGFDGRCEAESEQRIIYITPRTNDGDEKTITKGEKSPVISYMNKHGKEQKKATFSTTLVM
jgi:hypothetical protein